MRVCFAGSVAKDLSFPDGNEDAFLLAPELHRLALCDGASESFDSRTWAALLAQRFIAAPVVDEAWLDPVIQAYEACHQPEELSWSKAAAYERGSFATLLGVEFVPETMSARLWTIGDSLAVLVNDGSVVQAWPFADADQFAGRPELLSTNRTCNEFLRQEDFTSRHCTELTLQGMAAPVLMCVSDALGEWLLRRIQEGSSEWQALLDFEGPDALRDFVERERAARRLRVDDTTLAVVRFDGAEA